MKILKTFFTQNKRSLASTTLMVVSIWYAHRAFSLQYPLLIVVGIPLFSLSIFFISIVKVKLPHKIFPYFMGLALLLNIISIKFVQPLSNLLPPPIETYPNLPRIKITTDLSHHTYIKDSTSSEDINLGIGLGQYLKGRKIITPQFIWDTTGLHKDYLIQLISLNAIEFSDDVLPLNADFVSQIQDDETFQWERLTKGKYILIYSEEASTSYVLTSYSSDYYLIPYDLYYLQ